MFGILLYLVICKYTFVEKSRNLTTLENSLKKVGVVKKQYNVKMQKHLNEYVVSVG